MRPRFKPQSCAMKTNPLHSLFGIVLAAFATAATAGKAHEHGAARLDVAVEAGRLSLQLEAPLDSLFGFERAPRSDAERKRVEAGIGRLKAADALFRPDPAAGCLLADVELHSPTLGLGAAAPGAAAGEHADLDATIEFRCKDASKLGFIDTELFGAFANLKRVDVQAATPKGQLKRTLKRPAARITLTR
jgi:Protein of unknown function (DUF2796)